MEFVRKDELNYILSKISENPYGKFMITGLAGSGKSTLLNFLGKELQEQGKRIIYVNPFSVAGNRKSLYNRHGDENSILILDGIDQSKSWKVFVDMLNKFPFCCVCSSREKLWDYKYNYEISLNELNLEQMLLIIKSSLYGLGLSDNYLEEILAKLDKSNVYPGEINNIITELWQKSDFIEKDAFQLKENTHQLYTYGNGVLIDSPEIIVPERKTIYVPGEIKRDISFVRGSLMDLVAERPEILYEITWRQFEEVVCELFERQGYTIQLTKQTRDGGKDLILLNNSVLGDLMFYVECKQFAKTSPVDVALVRQLYGTVEADRVTAGIMVTTSYFSREAKRYQQKIRRRMNFIDYSELIKQIMTWR